MDYDVVVIGSGPGGYVAAIRAAQLKQKVAIVERESLGGICLNWGCIPTKALLRTAELHQIFQRADDFGLPIEKFRVDFPRVIQRSRKVAEQLSKGVAYLMKKNKIETIMGTAELEGANQIRVALNEGGERTISARNILLATGARAREIPGIEVDGEQVMTYRQALVVKELPKSIVIIGAGAIGVEFAYFFNALGSKVTLVEMMPRILPMEDEDVSRELEKSFKKQGIEVLTRTRVEGISRTKKTVKVEVSQNEEKQVLQAEKALIAIGVQGNVENQGLERVGIEVEKGWIKVNQYYQTNIPHIYAIGDIIGPPWLAHVASQEGIRAVEHMAGLQVTPLDYRTIPCCTYCIPQVASVGLTEQKAREEGFDVMVGKFPIRANGKALALGEAEGFIKMIFDKKYGELLGAHIIGPEATELITEVTLAKAVESTYMEILHTVHPHPTLSEIVAEATHAAIGEPIHI